MPLKSKRRIKTILHQINDHLCAEDDDVTSMIASPRRRILLLLN